MWISCHLSIDRRLPIDLGRMLQGLLRNLIDRGPIVGQLGFDQLLIILKYQYRLLILILRVLGLLGLFVLNIYNWCYILLCQHKLQRKLWRELCWNILKHQFFRLLLLLLRSQVIRQCQHLVRYLSLICSFLNMMEKFQNRMLINRFRLLINILWLWLLLMQNRRSSRGLILWLVVLMQLGLVKCLLKRVFC